MCYGAGVFIGIPILSLYRKLFKVYVKEKGTTKALLFDKHTETEMYIFICKE